MLTLVGIGLVAQTDFNHKLAIKGTTIVGVGGNFSLSVSPNPISVTAGSSTTATVTVTSIGSFSAPVVLLASAHYPDVTFSFSPATVTPPRGGSATSTLTIHATSAAGTSICPGNGTFNLFGNSPPYFDLIQPCLIVSNAGTETLTVATSGVGIVTSSPIGISCPGTCSAIFSSGASVTLTEAPLGTQTFTTWGGACSGSSTTCSLTMTSNLSVTATFTTNDLPQLPNFVDNNELTCQPSCATNSPGNGYTAPSYEFELGASSFITTPVGNPCSAIIVLPYAVTFAGYQAAINAMEACRTQQGKGVILDLPVSVINLSGSIIIPQTNTSAIHATTGLIVRSIQDSALAAMPEPVCAGGMQDNNSTALNPGLRNPDCDGQNLKGLLAECPTQSAGSGGLEYQQGMSIVCIPAGAFSFQNPALPATNTSAYNYLQYMPQLQESGLTAPILFCSAAPGAHGANACNSGTLPNFGPDLWEFEDLAISPTPGNVNNMDLFTIADQNGTSTNINQWASHIHFRRVWLHADWTSLNVGFGNIATSGTFGSCFYCSITGSQASEMLRPGAEGHVLSASGVQLKFANLWLECQSSCIFVGGGSGQSPILPIGSFIAGTDIQQSRVRCTFPLSWLGSQYGNTGSAKGGNIPNANPYWGGAGDLIGGTPTLVSIAIDGITVTWLSGPFFHDSKSSWPGNNVFLGGLSCPNNLPSKKCALVGASSWPQTCSVEYPPLSGTGNCFPANGSTSFQVTTLTLNSPVCTTPPCALVSSTTFTVNGSGIERKNGDEKKSALRYILSGNITENVDPSGGQRGILAAFSNRQTSGGPLGTNYVNGLFDVNVQDSIYRNGCGDTSNGLRSNPGGGNGGGASTPNQRIAFTNVLHENITDTNPLCNVVGSTGGMDLNDPGMRWTGTVVGNGTTATFGSANGLVTSVDYKAPVESDAITASGIAGCGTGCQVLTVTVPNTFVIGEGVWLINTNEACLNSQVVVVETVSITQFTTEVGSANSGANLGCSSYGTLADTGSAQGPVGGQVFGIPPGYPVTLSGAGCGAFATSTSVIGPITTGDTPWNGGWVSGNTTVSWPSALTGSATCTFTNNQGSPFDFYITNNTYIGDAVSAIGAGNTPSDGASRGINFAFQDNVLLNSGGAANLAGFYNSYQGEGTPTEGFIADINTALISNNVIPRPFGSPSVASLYTEYCHNGPIPAGAGCTPGSPPTTMFYPCSTGDPCTTGGIYASCIIDFLQACSNNIPLTLPDFNLYGLDSSSPYATASSTGGAVGVDMTGINAAQTANTLSPKIIKYPIIVTTGPFPDK